MKKTHYYLSALLIAFAVSGCASTPRNIPELDEARNELQKAKSNAIAQEAAGVQLKRAEEALRQAEESASRRRPLAETRQLAYVATRQAQIAQERVKEVTARKDVESGESERNRILLSARTSEAVNAQARAAEAKAESAGARAETERARMDAATQSAAAEQARKERDEAAEQAARLEAELVGLQAQQTERGMVLTLGDVLFDTAQATLRAGANLTIGRLADFLNKYPDFKVLVEGHTDSVGSDEYNAQLSQRRADAVANALATRGIASTRVRSQGLGEQFPAAGNDSPGARQQNRRVEIVFSDSKGEFSPSAQRVSNR